MRTKEEKKEKVESLAKEFWEEKDTEGKSMAAMIAYAYAEGRAAGMEAERQQQEKEKKEKATA